MQGLQLTTHRGAPVADSRDVAALIGKSHGKLLRDIRTYLGYLNQSKFGSVDFFIESGYTDDKGESRPCYLCTRKGCDMIANKMTGRKGVLFTATYVTRFHEMEQELMRRQIARTEGKQQRRELTDIIKELPDHPGRKWDYKLYTDLAYKATLGMPAGKIKKERGSGKPCRAVDLLTADELREYQRKEAAVAALLDAGLSYEQIKAAILPQCTRGNTGSNTIGGTISNTGGSADE